MEFVDLLRTFGGPSAAAVTLGLFIYVLKRLTSIERHTLSKSDFIEFFVKPINHRLDRLEEKVDHRNGKT